MGPTTGSLIEFRPLCLEAETALRENEAAIRAIETKGLEENIIAKA